MIRDNFSIVIRLGSGSMDKVGDNSTDEERSGKDLSDALLNIYMSNNEQ